MGGASDETINIKVSLEDAKKFISDSDKVSGSTKKIGSEVDKVDKSSRRGSKGMGLFNKQMGAAGRITDRTAGAMGRAARGAVGLAGAYIGIASAKQAVSVTQDLAASTIVLNSNLGLGVETSSQWAAVAKARGVDAKALGMSFSKLAAAQVKSAKATDKSGNAFNALGIPIKDLKKMDFNQLLMETADGLDKMGAGSARTDKTVKLFGKGWQSIAPILRDGSDGMREQLALAKKYNLTFNGKTVKDLKGFAAAQREQKMAMMGLQLAVGQFLIPKLTKLFQATASVLHQARNGQGIFGKLKDKLIELKNSVVTVVEWVKRHQKASKVLATILLTLVTALYAAGVGQRIYNRAAIIGNAILKTKAYWTKLNTKYEITARIKTIALTAATKAKAAWDAKSVIVTKAQALWTGVLTKANITGRIATIASTVATKAQAIWVAVVGGATKAWAAAQWVLNAALAANPITLIVIAVIALGAAFVLAYKKVGWFRAAVNKVFEFIKRNWRKILFPIAPFINLVILIVRNWDKIKKAAGDVKNFVVNAFRKMVDGLKSVPGKIRAALGHMWDPIKDGFKGAINWVIDAWNNLPDLKIGGGSVAGISIPKVGVSIPDLPRIGGGSSSSSIKSALSDASSSLKSKSTSTAPAIRNMAAATGDPNVDLTIMMDSEVLARASAKHKTIIASAVSDEARDKKARM